MVIDFINENFKTNYNKLIIKNLAAQERDGYGS